MTDLPDAVIARVVSALPGAYLWAGTDPIPDGDLVVFDGIVPPEPPTRYAVVYIDDGTLAALAACGRQDSATVRWQVTSVAPDRQQASWISQKIRDNTVDTTPTPDGWVCGPVNHVFSERPGRDETVGERPVVYKPDLYDLLATRA